MQDEGCGHFVHQFGTSGTGAVRLDQGAGDGGGGQALVPEGDGNGMKPLEIAHKSAGGLSAGPLSAIHILGKAEDEGGDLVSLDDGDQSLRILREFHPLDGFQRAGNAQHDIRQGQTNGLGAKIQPQKALVLADKAGQIDHFNNRHGVGVARRC